MHRATRRLGTIGVVLAVSMGLLTACYPPGTVLRGSVTAPAGAPAATMTVAVFTDPAAPDPVAQTTTNLGGGFAIGSADLADGSYYVQIAGAWWTGSGLSADSADAAPVDVDQTATPPNLVAVLPDAGQLAGTVADHTGTPVAGQFVALTDDDGRILSYTVSGTDGTFTLEGPVGLHHLTLHEPAVPGGLVTAVDDGTNAVVVLPDYIHDIGTVTRTTPVAVAGGEAHTCVATSSGGVSCWGANDYGQLGDGTETSRWRPTTVVGLTDATDVTAGGRYTCALQRAGHVACWGDNGAGQLGNGTTTDSSIPVPVVGITDATAVSAGTFTTCALHGGGTVSCWGLTSPGFNGEPLVYEPTPVEIPGITDAVAITVGFTHSCAVRANGNVACWGYNDHGQLGDGTTTDSTTPVPVAGITDATSASADFMSTCVLHAADTVSCWGNNEVGQLGDGTTISSTTPVAVVGITDASSIGSNWNRSCIQHADGGVSCWGHNLRGQLGDGTQLDSHVPVRVSRLTNATAVTTGVFHTCAVRTTGVVSCWGLNDRRQLGDGSTVLESPIPVDVIDLPVKIVPRSPGT